MLQPIAITGMGCRFPGNIQSPEELWQFVRSGNDAVRDLPDDRGWEIGKLYDPDPDSTGKFYLKESAFLRDVHQFDASFFGMSPREARSCDAQQKLLLEIAWEAVERSGIDPLSLKGTGAGVFIGCAHNGSPIASGNGLPAEIERFWGTGYGACVASGRIAYTLGIEGPALTIDTGCSSALAALHLACQSLRGGECDLALAGGVTVMSSPNLLFYFSRQRMLAPDGRSKSFAACADGMGIAEGAGLVMLERLSDARRRGHPVLAIIKGSALSQDGASNGLTAPSVHAQKRVIRTALRNAGLTAADIAAVEAHGTGTPVGDPVEATAILETYGQDRRGDQPLWLGSVKSNIGHTQYAAGAAGIIKMVMAIRHGELPKTLHIDHPTPQVDWNRGNVELLTAVVPWPEDGYPRRAGVSAFGVSGTNTHVIVEEPPAPLRRHARSKKSDSGFAGPAVPIVMSANSAPALRDQARRLRDHLVAGLNERSLPDIGYSLTTTRSLFDHRAVIIASDQQDLESKLDTVATDAVGSGVFSGRARARGKTVFVFPGQGSQWHGMGVRLMVESPVFAAHMKKCANALAPYVGWSLVDVIKRESADFPLNRVDIIQPMLFAIMTSLAELWKSMGVVPDAVVGHSQGEIAAAYACGALPLEKAAQIVALRSKLLAEVAGQGGMAAVSLSAEDTRIILQRSDYDLSIAAVNGPLSTVVSGDAGAVSALVASFTSAGIAAKQLAVDYASHSPHVTVLQNNLARAVSGISGKAAFANFYSTVTATRVDTRDIGPSYWFDNLRQPVRFADTICGLVDDGFRIFIEVSPHPVLSSDVRDTVDDILPTGETYVVVGSLARGRGGQEGFLGEVAKAHVAGLPVSWENCFTGHSDQHVDLPTHAFQRQLHQPDSLVGGPSPRQHDPVSGKPAVGGDDAKAPADPSGPTWFASDGDLFRVDWVALSQQPADAVGDIAIIGPDAADIRGVCPAALADAHTYPTLSALAAKVRAGGVMPRTILVSRSLGRSLPAAGHAADAHAAAAWALRMARQWLDAERLSESRLVVITREALACDPGEPVRGLPEATIWGLFRSVQAEHPGRVTLVDIDDRNVPGDALTLVLSSSEPQLTIRGGLVRVPRLVPSRPDVLVPPEDTAWCLVFGRPGDPDTVELSPAPEASRPLGPEEVRIAVRAVKVRPGDVATAPGARESIDMTPTEVAGVVVEAGSLVTSVTVGSRVAGLADGGAGSLMVTDHRRLVHIPEDWSFVEAAGALRLRTVKPGRIGAELVKMAGGGPPAPIRAWDVGRAREGFRAIDGHPGGMVLSIPAKPDPQGTFLISGGTGSLGSRIARHLVTGHGVKHLILVSRSGIEAAGAHELKAELTSLGASVVIATCDVADPSALRPLLAAIPPEHPLTGVVHAAGELDNCVVTSMTAKRLHRVLKPKVDAAWNLYWCTRAVDLSAFILFSSAAGTCGYPGQANYAAGNALLDSMASWLRSRGIPATALAWGPWESASGLIALTGADYARVARNGGALPLAPNRALTLFDRACHSVEAHLVPLRLDEASLHDQAVRGELDAMFECLVSAVEPCHEAMKHPAGSARSVFDLVTSHAAVVLDYASPEDVAADRTFKDLGFDSLACLEFRNRLSAATGLKLPTTLTWDYPTPVDLAAMLEARLGTVSPGRGGDS